MQTPKTSIIDKIIKIGTKVFTAVTAALITAMLLYSGYAIYDDLFIESKAIRSAADMLNYKPQAVEDPEGGLTGSVLAELNEDYRAWLTIPDTNIDYPVMQGKDELYYASHDVFKKTSLTGSLYLASQNAPDFSDRLSIIYGHHMDNHAFFGGLDQYADQAYFKKHNKGRLVTPQCVYDVTFFAMTANNARDAVYNVNETQNLSMIRAFINEHQIVSFPVTWAPDMKLLALSTCDKNETEGRKVLFGVMKERKGSGTGTGRKDGGSGADDGTGSKKGKDKDGGGKNGTGGAHPFRPGEQTGEERGWALLNLICTILAAYLVLPFPRIRAKYGRAGLMQEVNDACREEGREARYKEKRFRAGQIIGGIIEAVLMIGAVIVLLLTTDWRDPMVIINEWTPLFVIILAVSWIADLCLMRYRRRQEEADSKDATEQQ